MGKIYSLHFDLENVSTFSQKVLKLMWNVCFFLLSPEFSTPRKFSISRNWLLLWRLCPLSWGLCCVHLIAAQVAGHGVNTLWEVESSRLARTFWSMHVETIRFRTMNCSFVLNNSIMCLESLFGCYPSLWGPWWAIKPGFNSGTVCLVHMN